MFVLFFFLFFLFLNLMAFLFQMRGVHLVPSSILKIGRLVCYPTPLEFVSRHPFRNSLDPRPRPVSVIYNLTYCRSLLLFDATVLWCQVDEFPKGRGSITCISLGCRIVQNAVCFSWIPSWRSYPSCTNDGLCPLNYCRTGWDIFSVYLSSCGWVISRRWGIAKEKTKVGDWEGHWCWCWAGKVYLFESRISTCKVLRLFLRRGPLWRWGPLRLKGFMVAESLCGLLMVARHQWLGDIELSIGGRWIWFEHWP